MKPAKIAPSFNGMSGCPISQSVPTAACLLAAGTVSSANGAANRIRVGRGIRQVLAASQPSSGQSPCGSRPPLQSSQVLWRVSRGAMMRRRSSSSNSSVEACDRALGLVGRSAYPMLDPVGPIERVDPRPLGPVGPAVDTRDGGRGRAGRGRCEGPGECASRSHEAQTGPLPPTSGSRQ